MLLGDHEREKIIKKSESLLVDGTIASEREKINKLK